MNPGDLNIPALWIRIAVLFIGWVLTTRLLKPVFERWLTSILNRMQAQSDRSSKEKDQRVQTIVSVVSATLVVGLTVAIILIGLAAFGFNITPLIAGAGVVGFAIGFGSQNLVRDIINGLFILIEDQLGVGDVVEIGGVQGKVETFNLRHTVLRDEQGIAHYFANSQVSRVANLSQEWAFVLLHIKVGSEENTDRVIKLLKKTTREFMVNKQFAKLFHDNLEVDGLEELGGGTMTLRIRARVEGGSQWKIKRALLKLIKETFEKEQIELK